MKLKPIVCVFAKMWNRDQVKTRLAADIGQARAREIYRQIAEQVWSQLKSPDFERWLWISELDDIEDSAKWLSGADGVFPQDGDDLGERMQYAMECSFSSPIPWCAIVGTDAPAIDSQVIHIVDQAFEDGADLVITPALDGGYGLLAAKKVHPELFENMNWSTDQVLSSTLKRAEQLALSVRTLAPVRDIDTVEDLNFFEANSDGFFPQ